MALSIADIKMKLTKLSCKILLHEQKGEIDEVWHYYKKFKQLKALLEYREKQGGD